VWTRILIEDYFTEIFGDVEQEVPSASEGTWSREAPSACEETWSREVPSAYEEMWS
jgi:hypothetical protein